MLFVRPGVQARRDRAGADGPRAGGPRRGPGRPGVPARTTPRQRDPHVGHVHGRRPADLERPLRAARDGAADPDLAAVRRGPPLVGRPAAARRRSRRCRSSGSRRTSPTASGASPAILDDLDRELIGAAHPADHALPAPRGPRSGSSSGTGRRPRPRLCLRSAGAGWDRSPPSIRRSTRRCRASPSARRRCSGAVALWVPGTADMATRALLDAGPAPRRVPGAHLLVAGPTTRSTATCRSRWRSSERRRRRSRHRVAPGRARPPDRVLASGERGSLNVRSRVDPPPSAHDPRPKPRRPPRPCSTDSPGARARTRPDQAGRRPARRHEALPQRQGGAQGRRPHRPRGRLRVPRRAVGRRQVHAHEAAHPRRARDRGRRRHRRRGPRPDPAPPGAQGPAQDRDRVPGLQAAAAQDGLGERRVRARGHRDAAAPDPAGGRPRARARRPDRPGAAAPGPALGRRAAADGDRPRARPRPADHHRRRADRATSTRSSAGRSSSCCSGSTSWA